MQGPQINAATKQTMHDRFKIEQMAAAVPAFAGDRAARLDAFCMTLGRHNSSVLPSDSLAAAELAHKSQGWAHPVVVARLEAWLGAYRPEATP